MTTPENPQPPAEQQPPSYGSFGGAQEQYGAPPSQYGQQPPAYSGGGELAPWIYRVGEYIIDGIIIAVPSAIIGLVIAHSAPLYDILAFIGFLLIGYLNGAQGQSPGKRVIGVKIVRESDGQLIGGGMGVVRELAHLLDSFACLLGWLWPLWDNKNQTFADKLTGTVAVKTK